MSLPEKISGQISSLEGVESVDVNLEFERATVRFDSEKTSLDDIKVAIQRAGYSTEREKEAQEEAQVAQIIRLAELLRLLKLLFKELQTFVPEFHNGYRRRHDHWR